MSAITPESFSTRSFVYRKLQGAGFVELEGAALAGAARAGAALAADFGNGRQQAEKSGLLDLSVLPRTGFRGLNAAAHLQAADLPVPPAPNQASQSASGEIVLRLSQKEFWVLGSVQDGGAGLATLMERDLPGADCYGLYCQDSHAWMVLTGAALPRTLAKVCAVDLRPESFPVGAIAQTSVARINVIIVHHEINAVPCFSVFCDSAAAEYLWDALLDAMQEFGGDVIGTAALE